MGSQEASHEQPGGEPWEARRRAMGSQGASNGTGNKNSTLTDLWKIMNRENQGRPAERGWGNQEAIQGHLGWRAMESQEANQGTEKTFCPVP